MWMNKRSLWHLDFDSQVVPQLDLTTLGLCDKCATQIGTQRNTVESKACAISLCFPAAGTCTQLVVKRHEVVAGGKTENAKTRSIEKKYTWWESKVPNIILSQDNMESSYVHRNYCVYDSHTKRELTAQTCSASKLCRNDNSHAVSKTKAK